MSKSLLKVLDTGSEMVYSLHMATKGDKPMTTQPKDWQCQECGKKMTSKQAEKAMLGSKGCPKCGGADIDLAESR